MHKNSQWRKINGLFAKYFNIILAATYIVVIWTLVHYIKNFLLGEYITKEKHMVTTTQVNFFLLIAAIIFVRCYLKNFAFTLIELAIVLIVIGFVIAGISTGVSLVQTSRLNGLISEMRNYQTAALTFRDRYNAIPGDFARAFQTWGSLASCTNNDVNSVSTGCNGNGNGILGWGGQESGRAPQHLAAAGMINGTYNGTTDYIKITSLTNVSNAWSYYSDGSAVYNVPPQTYNVLIASGPNSGQSPFISSADAYAIDIKIDDGKPAKGFMRAFDQLNANPCAVLADGVTNTFYMYSGDPNGVFYKPSQTSLACTKLYFYIYEIPQ